MGSAGREVVPNTEEMAGPCHTASVLLGVYAACPHDIPHSVSTAALLTCWLRTPKPCVLGRTDAGGSCTGCLLGPELQESGSVISSSFCQVRQLQRSARVQGKGTQLDKRRPASQFKNSKWGRTYTGVAIFGQIQSAMIPVSGAALVLHASPQRFPLFINIRGKVHGFPSSNEPPATTSPSCPMSYQPRSTTSPCAG